MASSVHREFVSRVLIIYFDWFSILKLISDSPRINVHQFWLWQHIATAKFLVEIYFDLTFNSAPIGYQQKKKHKMLHWLCIGCILFIIIGIDPYFVGSYKIFGPFSNGAQNKKFYLIDSTWLLQTVCFFLLILQIFFATDVWGTPYLERTIFTRATSQPHSYVVGFKYVGDVTSMVITGGEISSNARVSFSFIFYSKHLIDLRILIMKCVT